MTAGVRPSASCPPGAAPPRPRRGRSAAAEPPGAARTRGAPCWRSLRERRRSGPPRPGEAGPRRAPSPPHGRLQRRRPRPPSPRPRLSPAPVRRRVPEPLGRPSGGPAEPRPRPTQGASAGRVSSGPPGAGSRGRPWRLAGSRSAFGQPLSARGGPGPRQPGAGVWVRPSWPVPEALGLCGEASGRRRGDGRGPKPVPPGAATESERASASRSFGTYELPRNPGGAARPPREK